MQNETIRTEMRSTTIKPTFYFPYIRFRNTSWVKAAALLYDELWRVIPDGYDFFDDPDIRNLRESCDFLRVHHPTQLETAEIGARFIEAYRSGAIDKARIRVGKSSEVHIQKLSYAVQEFLRNEGLALPGSRDEWFAMPANAAAAYMAFLSNEYARSVSGTIASDEAAMLGAVSLIQAAPNAITTNTQDRILAATFRTLGLRNAAEVEMGRIVDFRKRYSSERKRLLDEISRLAAEVPVSATGQDLQAFVNEKAHHIQTAVADLRRAAESIGIPTVSAACSAVLGVVVNRAEDSIHAAATIVGSTALGLLVSSIVQFRKERRSPVAYLTRIAANRAFRSHELHRAY
jgi:hypothetical protein